MLSDFAHVLVDEVWFWTSMAGLMVGLLSFLAAVRGSSFAPVLVMLTVPLQRVVLVGDSTVQLTWTQVALAGFVGGALLRLIGGELRFPIDVVTVAAFAVIAVYSVTVMVARDIGSWAGETYRWTAALFFLILARPYAAQLSAPSSLTFALALMAVVALIAAAMQALSGSGPSSFERLGVTRAYGAFGEPNPFGAFVVIVTLPCLALIAVTDRWRNSWQWRAAAAAGAAGIITAAFTQSRGAAIGLIAGMCVLTVPFLSRLSLRVRRVIVIGAASVAVMVVIFAAALVIERGPSEEVTPGNWPERERQAHWGAALRMVIDHPVLGVGAGGFNERFRESTTEWRFRISQGHAHNAYLQVAAETGLAGLGAYFALLGGVVWAQIGRIRTLPGDWLAWGALAVTSAIVVHGLFDYLHVLSLGIVLSGIWAFGMAGATRGDATR